MIAKLMGKKRLERIYTFESESVAPEVYFKQAKVFSDIALRELIVKVLLASLCFVVFATVIIIFLQGFHFLEFNLPIEFLRWSCSIAATVCPPPTIVVAFKPAM